MNRILFFIFSLFLSLGTFAQELNVKSSTLASNDLSASVNEVKDLNGEACALVKVLLNDEIAKVEGNVIKTIDNYAEK